MSATKQNEIVSYIAEDTKISERDVRAVLEKFGPAVIRHLEAELNEGQFGKETKSAAASFTVFNFSFLATRIGRAFFLDIKSKTLKNQLG